MNNTEKARQELLKTLGDQCHLLAVQLVEIFNNCIPIPITAEEVLAMAQAKAIINRSNKSFPDPSLLDNKKYHLTYSDYSFTQENPLTEENLKSMKPCEIFAVGEVINSPKGIYITDHKIGDILSWVAVRGSGYHDWAIYTQFKDKNWGNVAIAQHGQKIGNKNNVKKLILCNENALNLYRH